MKEKMIKALEAFSSEIYKILEVDLTNDIYEIIKSDQKQAQIKQPKMSEWISYFAKSGQVHEADLGSYYYHTDLDYLRNFFKYDLNKKWRLRYRRKIGDSYRWVSLDMMPTDDYTDEHQFVYLFVHDINQQSIDFQETQEDLRVQLKRERQNNRIIRHMMNIATWEVSFDELGNETSVECSKDVKLLLGFDEDDEFKDVFSSWTDRIHPDDIDRVIANRDAAYADKSNKIKFDVEYRHRMKNGEYRWFRSSGRYARWSDGIPYKFTGVFIDVDENHKS